MRGKRNTDRSVRKFITITDELKWEYIDRLQLLDKYKKSLNKVINDALDYGLPLLLKAEYGEIEEEQNPNPTNVEEPSSNPRIVVETIDDRKVDEITDLLEEVILNSSLCRSMLSSLFNERAKSLYGYSIRPEQFENGDLRDTPDFLSGHEKMILDRINESRRKRL